MMAKHRRFQCLLALVSIMVLGWGNQPASSQVTVWLDFASDIHNGASGGPNGKSDWIDELDKLTAAAGVDTFSPAERASIEAAIVSQLTTIYSGYMITFTTSIPSVGPFDAIAYGKNSFLFSSLGDAPVDFGNIVSAQVGGVATGNFAFILDEFSGSGMRDLQLEELSTALAGTGAHELGHTLGHAHHHAYSDIGIGPTNYLATGGLQNSHIMATGITGLTETGREVLRDFSPWERAMIDISGGAAAYYPTLDNQSLVASPVLINMTEVGPFDAGSTPMTALPVPLTPGETSGLDLAFIAGELDGFAGDVDWYRFTVSTPSRVMAELYSDLRFASPFDFDGMLMLLDSTGMPAAINDDVLYDGDAYGVGTFRQNDPFLLNIPVLTPGDYFIAVAASPTPSVPPMSGDAYWLSLGVGPIPEPVPSSALLLGSCLFFFRSQCSFTRRSIRLGCR